MPFHINLAHCLFFSKHLIFSKKKELILHLYFVISHCSDYYLSSDFHSFTTLFCAIEEQFSTLCISQVCSWLSSRWDEHNSGRQKSKILMSRLCGEDIYIYIYLWCSVSSERALPAICREMSAVIEHKIQSRLEAGVGRGRLILRHG